MARTMSASIVALPVAGRSSSSSSSSLVSSVRTAKLSRQAAPRCSAKGKGGEQACAESAQKCAPPPFKLSAVMVPMLAAAVVGGVQPAVQASEWDKFLAPVVLSETPSTATDEPYKDLLEKMKERRAAREKKTPTVQAEEKKSVEEPKPFSSSFFSPPPVFTPPAPPAPPPVAKAPEPAPAPPPQAVTKPSPVEEVVAPVVAADDQKTHGFLPLLLAQFLLFVATIGGGYVLITTSDSEWEGVQKTVDGYVSKATPVVESSWAKAKPLASQAQQKASQFAEAAKPYVIKAWEVSQPLAAKAVEASKPILKGAQTKAVELFEQATSKKP